jgi:hypothetical protein
MGILDAQSEARFAADDVHVESADGEMRRDLVVVGFGAERLRLRGRAGDEKIRREAAGRRVQCYDFAVEMEDCEMRGAAAGEVDLVVSGRADGVVAGLEPLETGEREPAVRLQEICDVLFAPGGEILLPGSLLRGCGSGEQH